MAEIPREPDELEVTVSVADGGRDARAFDVNLVAGFVIQAVVGEGGMGVVYKAQQIRPNRAVALKVVRPSIVSPKSLRRFEREAEILGRLNHSSIAAIYEVGTAKSAAGVQPYFAMEYVSGEPLTLFAAKRALPLKARLILLAQIADAVHYAHQKGIIHRDLKPANILVIPPNLPIEQPLAKVLDFGLAVSADTEIAATTVHTEMGAVLGTLAYMAPEQANGASDDIDTRTDVYALGAIAYELLTGQLPHDLRNRTMHAALRMIQGEEPLKLSSINKALRGDVETIVLKALAKEKSRRYQSASEFSADIRRYLADQPIQARPASTWYQVRKFAARNRPLVGGAAAVFVALVAGFAGTSWGLAGQRALRLAADQRAREAEQALTAEAAAKEEAVRQRDRAEQRFRDVRQLAHVLMFDLQKDVEDLPGGTPAVELMVRTAQDYLEKLRLGAREDPLLMSDLADAYEHVGTVQGDPGSVVNVGETKSALENFRKALAIREEFAAQHPADAEAQLQVGRDVSTIGRVLEASGDTTGAIESLRVSLAMVQRVADHDPANVKAQRYVAIVYMDIADVAADRGDSRGSVTYCEQGVAIFEKLAQADSADEADLAASELSLAFAKGNVGDTTAAVELAKRARILFQKVATRSPSHMRPRRAVAVTYLLMGRLLADEDPQSSQKDYDAALQGLEELAVADPRDSKSQEAFAMALKESGNSLQLAGLFEESLERLQRSLAIYQKLADADPMNREALRGVGGAHWCLGETYRDAGDTAKALEAYRQCVATTRHVAERSPDCVWYQRDLGEGLRSVGSMLASSGDFEGAKPCYAEALLIAEKVGTTDPDAVQYQEDLAAVHERIAEMLGPTGDMHSAMEHSGEALAICERLSSRHSESADVQGALRDACLTLSELHGRVARNSEASLDARVAEWTESYRWALRAKQLHDRVMGKRNGLRGGERTTKRIQTALAGSKEALEGMGRPLPAAATMPHVQ